MQQLTTQLTLSSRLIRLLIQATVNASIQQQACFDDTITHPFCLPQAKKQRHHPADSISSQHQQQPAG
jgi:hypothetical protein